MFEIVILSSVCKIIKQTPQKFDGDKQYVATGDLKNSEIISSTKVTYENRPSRADCTVNAGDVLFAKMAGTEKTLVAKKYHEEMLFSTGFAVLRPVSGILDSGFLYHILRSENFLSQKDRMSSGATQRAITNKALSQMKISIPPLMEQKRIAAILDKADEIKQSTEDAEISREKLAQSQFLHLFGDPAINQMGWSTTEISEIIEIQGGFSFKSQDYVSQGIKLLKISNVHFLNANWDKVDYLPEKYLDKYQQFSLNENDIVIALTRPIIQSLNNVKVIKISSTDLPCLLNQRVARFQINEEIINPYFLFFFLLTPYFKNKIVEFCSTSLQPNVSTKQIGEISIYLPPITLQNQFANFVIKAEKLPLTTTLAKNIVNSAIHDLLS
jgi:type I restriction enzyme S subunit